MIEFKPVTDEALRYIAENMRNEDIAEIKAARGDSPHDALVSSVAISEFNTVAYARNTPLVVFGLRLGSPITSSGVPWMLGATDSLNYKREFLLKTPLVIREMLTIRPFLYNYVHSKNRTSIRWLKWLGFTLQPAKEYGINGELFHRFYIGSK